MISSAPLRVASASLKGIFSSFDVLASFLRTADVFMLLLAAYVMYWIRFHTFDLQNVSILCVVCALMLFLVLSQQFLVYKPDRLSKFSHQLMPLTIAVALTLLCLLAILFFVHSGAIFSRIWIGGWFVFSFLGMLYIRLVLAHHITQLMKAGLLGRNVVLIGTKDSYQDLATELQKNTSSLRVWGIFIIPEDDLTIPSPYLSTGIVDILFIPSFSYLLYYCRTYAIDDVMITADIEHHPLRGPMLQALEALPCNIKYCLPSGFMDRFPQAIELMGSTTVVTLLHAPLQGKNYLIKRMKDIIVATLGLLLASPFMLIIALCIMLERNGPILYRQTRNGFVGAPFTIYKFRSMKADHSVDGKVVQATKNDKRTTRIGKIIRTLSFDELPQLWNVLKGEMSIVGPRPHAQEHNEHYAAYISEYAARHRIKPGITGWAQVNGLRGETDTLEKMHLRVQYDLYYINNWTLWLDLKIILLTLATFLTHENAY